jgi:hypothetical protein
VPASRGEDLPPWAGLAWLDGDEPAASAVQAAFEAGRSVMSWMNVGEVPRSRWTPSRLNAFWPPRTSRLA